MKIYFRRIIKTCAFIAAGFLFSSPFKIQSQTASPQSEMRVVFAHGEHTSARHRKLTEKLQQAFNSPARNEANFHKTGALQILMGLQNNPFKILFPYQTSLFEDSQDRFFNFGTEGYILARSATHSDTENRASVFSLSYKSENINPLLELQNAGKAWEIKSFNKTEEDTTNTTARTIFESGGINCLAKSQGRANIDKQFVCETNNKTKTNTGLENHKTRSCRALGLRSAQPQLEVFASGPSRCYFFHAARDSRYSAGPQLSKLVCLNTQTDQFDSSSGEDLRFIYPEPSGNSVLLYHTDSSPHRVFRFHMQGFKREEIGNSQTLGLKISRGNDSLTEGPLAYYGCKTQDSELQQLYLFPPDIYSGMRAVSASDVVWRVQTDATRGLFLETLTYQSLMNIEPELDSFPKLNCLQDSSIDVKCALKSMQFAAQISWEEKQGVLSQTLTPELRMALFNQSFNAMQKINSQLPHWQLRNESTLLANFFAKKLNLKHWQDVQESASLLYAGEKKLHSYLRLPPDFWTQIKSEIQP